jgi:hypothetical protein
MPSSNSFPWECTDHHAQVTALSSSSSSSPRERQSLKTTSQPGIDGKTLEILIIKSGRIPPKTVAKMGAVPSFSHQFSIVT